MAQYTLLWSPESIDDVEKIYTYLFDINRYAANKTDEEIETAALRLLDNPELGVVRDDFRGRRLIVPSVSMIIFYEIEAPFIRIVRVLHQKQKYPSDT